MCSKLLCSARHERLSRRLQYCSVRVELERERIVNWSFELVDRLRSRLYALWNRTAGDCLLDSVFQASFGIFDQPPVLRKALSDSLVHCKSMCAHCSRTPHCSESLMCCIRSPTRTVHALYIEAILLVLIRAAVRSVASMLRARCVEPVSGLERRGEASNEKARMRRQTRLGTARSEDF